jgi:hypothetical protein
MVLLKDMAKKPEPEREPKEEAKRTMYKCSLCGEDFESLPLLNAHRREKHPKGE